MITLSVLYPRTADSTFDFSYYVQKHIPLVRKRMDSLGLEGIDLLQGTGTPDGGPPLFAMIALLRFQSVEHLQNALQKHGAEVVGDIVNFTGVQPVLQLNQTL